MPDPIPTPPATETPAKPRRPRSALNQEQIDDLNKAEQLCLVAQRTEFATALAARDINAAFVTALQNDIATARATAGDAVGGTASRESATDAEDEAMAALITAVREIQTAAKQKYHGAAPAQLGHYYIGESLKNRARLDQIATALGDRLGGATPQDALPGINAAKVTQLGTHLQTYRATNVTQTGAQGVATGARSTLAEQVDSINARRRQLQFAAEAEWPSSKETNAATRREFQLPPGRPFNG